MVNHRLLKIFEWKIASVMKDPTHVKSNIILYKRPIMVYYHPDSKA